MNFQPILCRWNCDIKCVLRKETTLWDKSIHLNWCGRRNSFKTSISTGSVYGWLPKCLFQKLHQAHAMRLTGQSSFAVCYSAANSKSTSGKWRKLLLRWRLTDGVKKFSARSWNNGWEGVRFFNSFVVPILKLRDYRFSRVKILYEAIELNRIPKKHRLPTGCVPTQLVTLSSSAVATSIERERGLEKRRMNNRTLPKFLS